MNNFVSIDPGKTGAIVVWEGGRPKSWHQFDVKVKGQRFFEYDDLNAAFAELNVPTNLPVVIEALRDFGIGKQSIARNNTTAANWGVLYGNYIQLDCHVTVVTASAWKRRLGLGPDKEPSIAMAKELYPECIDSLKFKKNHDLAEAILIGHDYKLRMNDE